MAKNRHEFGGTVPEALPAGRDIGSGDNIVSVQMGSHSARGEKKEVHAIVDKCWNIFCTRETVERLGLQQQTQATLSLNRHLAMSG